MEKYGRTREATDDNIIHIVCSVIFFPKIVPSKRDNVEKYGKVREATDDNIIQRTHTVRIG